MNAENLLQAVRILQRRTPFEAFTVFLVDGRKIEVEHPEALALRGNTALFIGKDGDISFFDANSVFEVKGKPELTAS